MEKPIRLSDVETITAAGYTKVSYGDASNANSDFFMIMEKTAADGSRSILIICPTFLRGPLVFSKVHGGIGYSITEAT